LHVAAPAFAKKQNQQDYSKTNANLFKQGQQTEKKKLKTKNGNSKPQDRFTSGK
jgi:hypothetical protein